ncbi:MAG: hypothetical protein HYZ48_02015, partial [Chlamydiales bacterium]|nr:hypothetical protein [Chlamydiales bacterium]
MLMSSCSHAFTLLPCLPLFQEGWKEDGFTYTWVRDRVFSPMHQFYAQMQLHTDAQHLLIEQFLGKLPSAFSYQLHQRYSFSQQTLTPMQFRASILECFSDQKSLLADQIDSFLYEMLPIVPGNEVKALIKRLFSDRFEGVLEEALDSFLPIPLTWVSAKRIKEVAKMCWIKAYGTGSSFDLHEHIAKHARFLNLAAPTPLLFADTNWTWVYFGFVVNPGTGRLELWRLDPT